jgi:hypothetical protein
MNNEPVAWMSSVNGETVYVGYEPADGWLAIPLYTHPAKTLTDEEITDLFRASSDHIEFARAILRKAQEQ